MKLSAHRSSLNQSAKLGEHRTTYAGNIEMPTEFKFSGYVHLFGRYVHLDETSGSGEAGSHFRLKIDDRSRCALDHAGVIIASIVAVELSVQPHSLFGLLP